MFPFLRDRVSEKNRCHASCRYCSVKNTPLASMLQWKGLEVLPCAGGGILRGVSQSHVFRHLLIQRPSSDLPNWAVPSLHMAMQAFSSHMLPLCT